jgi:hypothetical protein
MPRFSVGLAGLIGLTFLLAGCKSGPVYPLMTPLQVAQSFGYDDHPLGDNKYEVLYVAPQQNAIGFRYDTTPTERAQKDMAFDLATLRAAQMAQQSGWKGFDVIDKHSSTDNQFYDPWYDNGWGDCGPWGWGGGWGWHGWGGWGGRCGWDGGFYNPPEQRVQVEVKLTIVFVTDVKPGQYSAQSVIDQVTARYPGVLGPMPSPPPPSPPKTGA